MEQLKFSNRFLYPKLKIYDGLIGKLPIVSPSFYLGIEVEAENVSHIYSHQSIPGSWKSCADGSLKDHGMEYVTVPIRFKYIEMELRRLYAAIPKAIFSPRTSIHVHMNSRDFTNEELFKFLLLYLIFERNLYSFSGNRWNNNFCVPVHEGNIQRINKVLKDSYTNVLSSITWSKYYGLNLLPLVGEEGSSVRYGTIEFRHMAGTNDIEYIINWCNLILSLKLAAKRFKVEDIKEAIVNCRTSDDSFIHAVFRKFSHLISVNNYREQIKESTRDTKVLLLVSNIITR